MTEPIEPLNIFNTDYADIVYNSDNLSFELYLEDFSLLKEGLPDGAIASLKLL